jgi:hypothetical protein
MDSIVDALFNIINWDNVAQWFSLSLKMKKDCFIYELGEIYFL